MTQCRFCKSDIPTDATRCPHCTSFLDGEQQQGSQGQVTYFVDKGLVTFAKFAGSMLALFTVIGISLYGINVKELRDEIHKEGKEIEQESKAIKETFDESQKEAFNIKQFEIKQFESKMKQVESELQQAAAFAKKDIESAEEAAKVASETSSRVRSLLEEAEQSKQRIHEYEITLSAPAPGSKLASSPQASQPGPDPAQVDRLVDARLLEALQSVLPAKQYSALKTKLLRNKPIGRRPANLGSGRQ